MEVADIIGYIAAAIGTVVFLPQVIRAWKTKRTKDISLLSFTLLAIVSVLWVIYGILLKSGPLISVNSIILGLTLVLLYLKHKYG